MPPTSVLRTVIQAKSVAQAQPETSSAREIDAPLSMVFDENNDLGTQLGILVENAPVALAMFDDQMRYMVANRFWIEEFGLQQVQPLIGRSQYEVFPGLHPGWRQVYDRALQGHVVRSEHDAISGQDGKAIVYRWEVRPWRRKRDASVGGLMVICEKFAPGLGPAGHQSDHSTGVDPTAIQTPAAQVFDSALPVVVLDDTGVISQANEAAVTMSSSREILEGASCFYDAFSDGSDQAALKGQVLDAIFKLSQNEGPPFHSLITRTCDSPAGSPIRWTITRTKAVTERGRFVAVAFPGASPFDVGPKKESTNEPVPGTPASPDTIPIAPADNHALISDLEEKLNRSRQEITVLREAEVAFARREGRQRAVLEALACGLIVLDERGMPIYQNEQVSRLMGRSIQRGESVEQWLVQCCPTEPHRERITGIWTQDIWSRQLTKTMSLATADGLIKELEFRPVALTGGGVLVSIQDVTDQCRIEDLLQSTESRSRVLLQESPVGVLLADTSSAVFEANPIIETMTGRSKAELRRLSIDDWLTQQDALKRREALSLMREEGRRTASLDVQIKPADGAAFPVHIRIASVSDPEGQPQGFVYFLQRVGVPGSASPVEVRSQAAGAKGAAEGLSASQEGQPGVAVRWLLQTDQSGRIAAWSADARNLFGHEAEEIMGSWLHSLFRPSDPTGFYAVLQDRVVAPDEAVEWGYFGKGGQRGNGRFFVKSAGEGSNAVDLFEEHLAPGMAMAESAANPGIRTHIVKPSQLWPMVDLDREKLLLSETHHRIKNHLQIISSMLNLQLNSMADQGARDALRSSQNRVRSIAALHQHLYQLALGEGPGFEDFAKGLSQRLRECYEVPEERIALRMEITTAHLQQEWMMPLALILNETLSNAFEHAFPQNRQGAVTVRLSLNDGTGEFEVSDDGVGLPEGFDPAIAPGLGLKILGVFADQMHGELKLSGTPEGGTKFNLRFPMAHVDN